MKRLSVVALFLLSGLASPAARAQSDPFVVDLSAQKLDVPAGPWQVVRVLDQRADRSRLGFVHQGLANQTTSAHFSRPLATELLQLLQRQPTPGTRPVVMRVLTMTLSEDMRPSSEHAEAELVTDFLEPLPDSTFRVLLTVGEVARRGGLDATRFHPTNLALVVQQALRRLAAVPAPGTGAEVLSRADALAGRGGAAGQRFAIQQAAAPRRGLYRSFEEFRDNKPSEPEYPFFIERTPRPAKRFGGIDAVQPYYLHTDNAHPRRPVPSGSVWGLSDGQDMLIAYRGRFYQLLPAPDGRSYTFVGPPLYDAEAATNVAIAGAVGGLLGAAVASGANRARTLDGYEVHLASGRVVPIEEPGQVGADGFSNAVDTAAVFVYRRPGPASAPAVTFTATGQAPSSLQAREWTAITWRDRRRELKLCVQLGTAPEACREFVPDFTGPTFLECVVPAGGGPPELRVVPAKEGRFELKRIQLMAKKTK